MIRSRIENKLPVAREGLPFIVFPVVISAGLAAGGWLWPAGLILALAGFSAWFFRDPDREPPGDERAVLSPADGVIIDIAEVDDDCFLNARALKISIFMSIFNVHVNRAPLAGQVETVKYSPGRFFSANLAKASRENEHNAVILQDSTRERIAVVQIAGLVARRIACWVSPGDSLRRGQRFGLIRFGSRLDVYLPLSFKGRVQLKQKVKAGRTILGTLS